MEEVMIQRYHNPHYVPQLGLRICIQGSESDAADYQARVATLMPSSWEIRGDSVPEGGTPLLKLTVCLEAACPPTSAIQCPEGYCHGNAIYRHVDGGWIRFEVAGVDHWTLTRSPQLDDLQFERALFRIAAIRAGGLPLHASVGTIGGVGVALLGAAGSGKTAALLSLLEHGGQWIGDDEVYCGKDLRTVAGTSAAMMVKASYLRQMPQLQRLVSPGQRLRLQLGQVARRFLGVAACSPVPAKMRRRLQRTARGCSSVAIRPTPYLASTTVDAAVVVFCGAGPRLEPLDSQSFIRRATQILWAEARALHDYHRMLESATGQPFLVGEKRDERLLETRVKDFVKDKRTFVLVRSQTIPLKALGQLLEPVWAGLER